jgi:hypothetical protein
MFGIQVSNTKYPVQALRAMALQGKVMRLAIIGRTDVVGVGWDAGEQGRVYAERALCNQLKLGQQLCWSLAANHAPLNVPHSAPDPTKTHTLATLTCSLHVS